MQKFKIKTLCAKFQIVFKKLKARNMRLCQTKVQAVLVHRVAGRLQNLVFLKFLIFQDLMRKISNRIQEIESQKYEVVSNKSSSSSSSSRSRSSTKSGISKISDLSVRKAALKTKLKYLDIESKFKVELQKNSNNQEIRNLRCGSGSNTRSPV